MGIFRKSAKPWVRARSESPGAQRLHIIPLLMRANAFAGEIELNGDRYEVSYVPSRVEVVGRRLRLTGRLAVRDPRGTARERDGVRALVVASQGGIGSAPPRPSGRLSQSDARAPESGLPEVENTGRFAFTGVVYGRLESVSGSDLSIPADLSGAQLHLRLLPKSDYERELHWLYGALVEALYGSRPDTRSARSLVTELNRRLASRRASLTGEGVEEKLLAEVERQEHTVF